MREKEAHMNVEVLKVAVVGCGYHGTALARAVERANEFELAAGVDPDPIARQAFAAAAEGVSTYDSITGLLAENAIDAVLIATTHDALAPTALAAIRAGKHVMVEKPMALNEDQAKEVEFAAASAGVTCMVGYSFRYGMAHHVQQLLTQGTIGDVRVVTGAIATGAMDEGWVARADSGGGPMLYVGCHLIDLALWFMHAEPTNVVATVHDRPDTGVDATSAITLEFSGGRLAQFLVTQTAPGFFYDLRIIGSAGLIGLRGRNFVQFDVEVQSETHQAYHDPTLIRPAMQGDHISMMLVPELSEFAAAIAEKRAPAITATDGRKVLRVMDAARRSSDTQQSVRLQSALSAY
jgi:predicted dehydrogenase